MAKKKKKTKPKKAEVELRQPVSGVSSFRIGQLAPLKPPGDIKEPPVE